MSSFLIYAENILCSEIHNQKCYWCPQN